MNKKAYVKQTIGDMAVLSVKRECMCAKKEGCEIKCFTLQNDTIEVSADNAIGAKAGDFVEIEGKTSAILIYSAVVFILPVFTGLSLYFIAGAFTESIILPYIVSGAGFVSSVCFLYFFLNNIVKGRDNFKITKIL